MRTFRHVLHPFATLASAMGVALFATGCGGGGTKDFTNPSLVTLSTSSASSSTT